MTQFMYLNIFVYFHSWLSWHASSIVSLQNFAPFSIIIWTFTGAANQGREPKLLSFCNSILYKITSKSFRKMKKNEIYNFTTLHETKVKWQDDNLKGHNGKTFIQLNNNRGQPFTGQNTRFNRIFENYKYWNWKLWS